MNKGCWHCALLYRKLDRQLVKNKMSLSLFKDWTEQLQTRMHTELNVLCEINVVLQVDNNVLMDMIQPLLSLERKELQQEGEDMQAMLQSESDLEVMKKSMIDIGNLAWKQITERLESWVTKPFYSLQGAFITDHDQICCSRWICWKIKIGS